MRVITIFLWLVIPLVRQCLEIHCDQSITIVLLKFQWLRHGQRSLQSTINSFINTLHVQKWFHHWIAITWKSSHATNWKNSKYKIIDFCCHQIFDFFRSAQGILRGAKKTQIQIFWNFYTSRTNINIFQLGYWLGSNNWFRDALLQIASRVHNRVAMVCCWFASRGSVSFRSYNRIVEKLIASRWWVNDSLRDGLLWIASQGSASFRSYNRMVEKLIASRWWVNDSLRDGLLQIASRGRVSFRSYNGLVEDRVGVL